MNQKTHIDDIVPIEDVCGQIRETYSSENISIAHVVVTGDAKPHLHRKMEEVYYVTKGQGQVVIGDKTLEIREGDTIPIPKDTVHYLRQTAGPLEILAITHPKFDPSDMIPPPQ